MKRIKALYITISILSLLAGIALVIWPGASVITICYVVGSAAILVGKPFFTQYTFAESAFSFKRSCFSEIRVLVGPGNIGDWKPEEGEHNGSAYED